jgi:MHS family proline/betaine transporter-like MFS transporter
VGGALAVVGLILRLGVEETPVFTAAVEQQQNRKGLRHSPLRELLAKHRRAMGTVLVFFASVGVLTHMMLGYMPTYLVTAAGVTSNTALVLTMTAMIVPLPVAIILSVFVEKVGRRPFIRVGAVSAVLVVIPCYLLIGTGNKLAIGVALIVLMVVLCLLNIGLLAVLEILPTRLRYIGTAVPYNVAYALFAGTAPLVCQALVDSTGSALAPAFYGTVIALLACPVLRRCIPETKGTDLRTV